MDVMILMALAKLHREGAGARAWVRVWSRPTLSGDGSRPLNVWDRLPAASYIMSGPRVRGQGPQMFHMFHRECECGVCLLGA